MALPTSGQITVKQINAEFGGSNTLKSNATIAGISTSNVGCKSFYGLSAAIDPVYIQETPVTSTTGWDTGNGTAIQVISSKLRFTKTEPASKLITQQAVCSVHRDLVCTPSTTYTVSFQQSGSSASVSPGSAYIVGTTDFNTNGSLATKLGSVNLLYNSTTATKSFTFSSTVSAVTLVFLVYGSVSTSTVDGIAQANFDQITVQI